MNVVEVTLGARVGEYLDIQAVQKPGEEGVMQLVHLHVLGMEFLLVVHCHDQVEFWLRGGSLLQREGQRGK